MALLWCCLLWAAVSALLWAEAPVQAWTGSVPTSAAPQLLATRLWPPTPVYSAGAAGGSEAPPCLVACSGEGKSGSLTVLRRSVVPDVITEVPLPGALDLYPRRPSSLAHACAGRVAACWAGLLLDRRRRQWVSVPTTPAAVAESPPIEEPVLACPAGVLGAWAVHYRPGPSGGADGTAAEEGAEGYHAYLLLSFPGATKVLATGEELREVTEL